LTSTPSGAEVYLDGVYLGTTPIRQQEVMAGSHDLNLILSGYMDYSTSVTVLAGATKTVAVTLAKSSVASTAGTLTVNSDPSGARIYLDDEDTGKCTPGSFTLALGVHTVKLIKAGYLECDGSVQLTAGGSTETFTATLTEAPTALPAPKLLGPSSGSAVSSTPTLSWIPVPGASHYVVDVWNGYSNSDRSDSTRVFRESTSESSIKLPEGKLQVGTSYAWAVWAFRSTDPAGFMNSNGSTIWWFTTEP
ncbi:MAG: PEGA domain-containing protein, partial [Candidatus Cryosericum sp.]